MNKKTNLINNIILLGATILCVFLVTFIGNSKYVADLFTIIVHFLVGAVIMSLINTLCHEFGHIISGKKQGFEFISLRIWFLTFTKNGKKIECHFSGFADESGATEMIPKTAENLDKRYAKMTMAGSYGSFVLMILSIIPLFFAGKLPLVLYCYLSVLLPISVYFFLANILPMSSEGLRNDGAVLYGIRKNDDASKVMLGLLKINAELYHGKAPSEIDESLYFDLPQIEETDINYMILLNNRYAYYLDKSDYENAKKSALRLEEMLDDIPKCYRNQISADLLYNACTFDFNETKADNLMEDLDKYINNDNSVANLRTKLAYLVYILKDYENARVFITKLKREISKQKISGLKLFEQKLLDKILLDVPVMEESDDDKELKAEPETKNGELNDEE